MNLLSYYQKKIFSSLKSLEKKKLIQISSQIKKISVELPPKSYKADLSCNAAMILAKDNNSSPIKLAETLKKKLLMQTMVIFKFMIGEIQIRLSSMQLKQKKMLCF